MSDNFLPQTTDLRIRERCSGSACIRFLNLGHEIMAVVLETFKDGKLHGNPMFVVYIECMYDDFQ